MKEDEDDGPDGDLPRLKVDTQNTATYVAYLQRYLRRNQHSPSRKTQAMERTEVLDKFVFDVAQPFRIVGCDVLQPDYLQVTQGGQPRSGCWSPSSATKGKGTGR